MVRFILFVILLVATGLGLLRVTKSPGRLGGDAASASTPALLQPLVPYRLLLSAPARLVEIDTGTDFRAVPQRGSIALDPENPHIALRIQWVQAPAVDEQRFAKLSVEVPGAATFTHVFDAKGDIDDYVELPITSVK